MVSIDFGRTSNPDRTGFASSQRLINGYAEQIGQAAKTPLPVYATPGTVRFDTGSPAASGPCRGMLVLPNAGLYVAAGNAVRRYDDAGTASAVTGTALGGTGFVTLALNQNGSPQIGMVTSDGYYVLDTASDVLSKPEIANLPQPVSIAFMDGYFVFAIADGRIFHSAINDAFTVNALSFATAQSRSDGLRRIVSHRGALIVLGETSLEIWENAGTTPFAFARVRANIDIGCIAEHSVATVAETLMWVDHNGIVRRLSASEPERVSTHALERAIAKLDYAERRAIHAVVTSFDGHDFFAITSPRWTWEYDLGTGLWHERQSEGKPYWFAKGFASYNGKSIVGSESDESLHRVDVSAHTESGMPYVFIAQSAPINAFPSGAIFDALSVDIVPGVGVTGRGDDAAAPKLMLDWSDDGGATWVGGRIAPLGSVGQRNATATFYQLGACGRAGRTFRLSASSSVMRGILNADARIRPVRQG